MRWLGRKLSRLSRHLGFQAKDWITITLSILAFVFSITTGYVTSLRRTDELSAVIRFWPKMYRGGDFIEVDPNSDGQIVFINSGNRPAVVTVVDIVFVQHSERLKFDCYHRDFQQATFETDFKTTVIKENDVAVTRIRLMRRRPTSLKPIEGGDFKIPIFDDLKSQKNVSVELCLKAFVNTPSLPSQYPRVSYLKVDVHEDGSYFDDEISALMTNKPHRLVKHHGTVFWD